MKKIGIKILSSTGYIYIQSHMRRWEGSRRKQENRSKTEQKLTEINKQISNVFNSIQLTVPEESNKNDTQSKFTILSLNFPCDMKSHADRYNVYIENILIIQV